MGIRFNHRTGAIDTGANLIIGNYEFDTDQTVGAGQDNYVLTYDDATGLISLEVAAGGGGGITDIVEDTTPQLGGNLDAQAFEINNVKELNVTPTGNGDSHLNWSNLGQNFITNLTAQYTRFRSYDGVSTYTTLFDVTDSGLDIGSGFNMDFAGSGGESGSDTAIINAAGNGTIMTAGDYCSWGRNYSEAATFMANNAYVKPSDAVSGQYRTSVTHASYGHTIYQQAGGIHKWFGNNDSVTADAVVSKILQMDLQADGTLNVYGPITGDSFNGYALSSVATAPPGASQIVKTHTNGYTYLGWINTVSGGTTTDPDRIYCSYDSFLRYMTPTNFIDFLEGEDWNFSVEVKHTDGLNLDYGMHGGYVSDGATFGATIFSIGQSWKGNAAGANSANGNVYGLRYLRGSHTSAYSTVGEGIYTMVNGVIGSGMGQQGIAVPSGGDITKVSHGNYLFHKSTSYDNDQNGEVTFSTSAASGGTTGDIWFQYVA